MTLDPITARALAVGCAWAGLLALCALIVILNDDDDRLTPA